MLWPAGVTAISILLFAAAIYLWTIGVVMVLAPGAISRMSGAPLMYGLELAGPYMALLVGCGWALVARALFRLHNWARWAAMLVMTLGIAWLVPKISASQIGWPLPWSGLQIAVRAAAAWYLRFSAYITIMKAFLSALLASQFCVWNVFAQQPCKSTVVGDLHVARSQSKLYGKS